MKKGEISRLEYFLIPVIGIIIASFFVSYYNTPQPNPKIYSTDYLGNCYLNTIPIGKNFTYEVTLKNGGTSTNLFSGLCFYSENITFKDKNYSYKGKYATLKKNIGQANF